MAKDLAKWAKDKGVKYFMVSYTDLFGGQRAKLVPAQAINDMAVDGAGFAGFATWLDLTPAHPDMMAVPDPESAIQLPWKREVAWLASNCVMEEKPLAQAPRNVLRRLIDEAAKDGLRVKTGVEPEFFGLARRREDGGYLLCASTTHPHKNHEFLLRLVANEWRNEDVKLVMVGGSGLAESQIQSLISEFGVANKVVRSGRVQAVDRDGLIALAEALLFPSKYEGFGAPVLEAMALGTPVISSDCASLPEVVGDGGLVLPLTSEAWAGALNVIRAQRSTLVHNGLRRAEEFTSAKSAQDLVIAYEKTLAAVSR